MVGEIEQLSAFLSPQGLNFTNSVQGLNFKKLGRFINNNILEIQQIWSSFLEFTPCDKLVKLSQEHQDWLICLPIEIVVNLEGTLRKELCANKLLFTFQRGVILKLV